MFARSLFLTPSEEDLPSHEPSLTVVHAPNFETVPEIDGTNSDACIALNFGSREVFIAGTKYAGEIKKSVFSFMNYVLPGEGILPMHCSANVGEDGDVAIFFGLSGTGKTTLSTTHDRALVGDDEHGWSDEGVFNFEGGCYAKVIRLSEKAEPEIYGTTKRFGTVLENVIIDPATRRLDLDDDSRTENTRGAYPITFMPNAEPSGVAGVPANVIMLTADAFGVLPPLSRLSVDQAVYYFLSGYTAKGGRDGARHHRAPGHVQPLLRGALHGPRPRGLRRHAAREDRQARRARLAGQHGMDRRPLRRRQPPRHRQHPGHAPRHPQRRARRRRLRLRPDVRT